jgi:hypothetical protein
MLCTRNAMQSSFNGHPAIVYRGIVNLFRATLQRKHGAFPAVGM